MHTIAPPLSPITGLRVCELGPEHEKLLQQFFEANPAYFYAVNGEPAGPGEAHEEIHGMPPVGWSFTKKWLIGYVDGEGALVAMANVISELLAPGVWHISLFIIATSRHGTGEAQALLRGLEKWAQSNGASWLRLGVVQGNGRAERFWEAAGFLQTRTRERIKMGKRNNTLRVMFKLLSGGSAETYISLVPCDAPDISYAL